MHLVSVDFRWFASRAVNLWNMHFIRNRRMHSREGATLAVSGLSFEFLPVQLRVCVYICSCVCVCLSCVSVEDGSFERVGHLRH